MAENIDLKNKNEKMNTILTLGVGITIGTIITASIIPILAEPISIWLVYLILILIVFISILFLVFWIYKKEIVQKVFHVSLKGLPSLVRDTSRDIVDRNGQNLPIRLYEIITYWLAFKIRASFIGLLVFLAGSLFLMLNAYVMFKQLEAIKEQTSVLQEQKKLSEIQVLEKVVEKTSTVHNEKFKDIIKSINACEILYEGNKGKYKYNEINDYLTFFDNIGIYEEKGAMTKELINDILGWYILAFYYNNGGEIKKYIEEVSESYSKPAYKNYLSLIRKIEDLPGNFELIKEIHSICNKANKARPQKQIESNNQE